MLFYGSRHYDPALGRFIQPDSIIPEVINPLAYDRYSYVYNNPVRYTDSSGHCIDGISTWACIAVAVGLVTKLIDYGWTAWDAYNSAKILSDPNASAEDKMLAGLNVGLAAALEGAEPDDLFPVGLPLDDVARRAILKGAKEALADGGAEAFEKYLRDQLGDHADEVLAKLGIGSVTDFGKLGKLVGDPLIEIAGGGAHAFNKHGVTADTVKYWSTLSKKVLSQGDRYLYITAEGAYVLGKNGNIITAYSRAEYTAEMVKIAQQLGILP